MGRSHLFRAAKIVGIGRCLGLWREGGRGRRGLILRRGGRVAALARVGVVVTVVAVIGGIGITAAGFLRVLTRGQSKAGGGKRKETKGCHDGVGFGPANLRGRRPVH